MANRRSLDAAIDSAWQQFEQAGVKYAVVLIDVDHFKQVNDRYGHDIGDRVLAEMANCLQISVRASDFVARYGGEEFVVLLPNTTARNAMLVAEGLRQKVEQLSIASVGHISISAGISAPANDDNYSGACIKRADQGLYQAKRDGRNRCVLIEPMQSGLETPRLSG